MKRLLIIDDSFTARLIIKTCLPKEPSFIIDEADGGASAIEMARENVPDLVLCDYNMPDRNGVEVALDFKTAGIYTKFVLVSANLQESVLNAAKEAGFVGSIAKPITKDKIKNCIQEFCL